MSHEFTTQRLGPDDVALARAAFAAMADGFDDTWMPLSDAYLTGLLSRSDMLVLAAFDGDTVIGGLTAHVLPMTRSEAREVFIYDLAIASSHQRRGAGSALVRHVRALAASLHADNVFVPADVEDEHAARFYRREGGEAADVTMFTFQPA